MILGLPTLKFYQELRVAHHEYLDFTCLPRFCCKAYRTLDKQEKGGKFDPRVEVGWFVGFQANTIKNFLIVAPRKTPQKKWSYKVFTTPHASFCEDSMYGPTMAKLQFPTPQQNRSGSGLGLNFPPTTSVDFLPPVSFQNLHPQIVPDDSTPVNRKSSSVSNVERST